MVNLPSPEHAAYKILLTEPLVQDPVMVTQDNTFNHIVLKDNLC